MAIENWVGFVILMSKITIITIINSNPIIMIAEIKYSLKINKNKIYLIKK